MNWLKLGVTIVVAEVVANKILDRIEEQKSSVSSVWGEKKPDPLTECLGDLKLFARRVVKDLLSEERTVTTTIPFPYGQARPYGPSKGGPYGAPR